MSNSENFDWTEKNDKSEKGKKGEGELTTEVKKDKDEEKTNVIEVAKEKEGEAVKDEIPTIQELEGKPFDPIKNLAILALVDIAPERREIRKLPKFFHVKRSVTKIGTGKRAHIVADDLKTVKAEHSAIVFKDGHFFIFPQEGTVKVNGEGAFNEGKILENGSQIEIGSARFIFLVSTEIQDENITLPTA